MHFIEALIAGGFIGLVLGFVGAGGAMLSVPILIYVFNFQPKLATVAALAIVFSAAFAGVIPKFNKKSVLVKDAGIIWALGLVTNIGGALLAKHLTDKFITVGFAFILVAAGTSMLLKPISDKEEKDRPLALLIFISLIIGAMTGIFGVGGGFLAIPILVISFHISHEKASGTSLLIIALNCLTAFITNIQQWGKINWGVPLTMTLSAVVVTLLASSKSHHVPTHLLRKAFAVLLYLIAIYTTFKSFR
jgi:uncharacterized membrane protein YfcA